MSTTLLEIRLDICFFKKPDEVPVFYPLLEVTPNLPKRQLRFWKVEMVINEKGTAQAKAAEREREREEKRKKGIMRVNESTYGPEHKDI